MVNRIELTDDSLKVKVMVNFDLVKYYRCLVRKDEPLTVIHFIDNTTITVSESYNNIYIIMNRNFN